MNEQETTEDIIAEMCAREDLDGGDMVDNFDIYIGEYGGWDALKLIKAYADRLDAAHKREIDEVTGLATKYRTALARINALATYCHQPDTRAQIIEQCENIFAEERNGKTKEMEVANGK